MLSTYLSLLAGTWHVFSEATSLNIPWKYCTLIEPLLTEKICSFCNSLVRITRSKIDSFFTDKGIITLISHFRVIGSTHFTINSANKTHVGNIQFLLFIISHLFISNAAFWFKPYLNRTSGCRDMTNFLKFKNNVIHKHLSPILASKSKSIFPTSDLFPLIMSQ